MQYYSTHDRSFRVGLQRAVMEGLAPDNGLYMPAAIPRMEAAFFRDFASMSFTEMAVRVAGQFLEGDIPAADLNRIVEHTLQFDAPLVRVESDVYALELFHGPTMAFKDFGARFLSGLVGYFARQQSREITILVATSGDTGSAVANGFLGVPGTRVIVLYPSGKVSEIQEKQFTTLGSNIIAIEVDGTFDDCQRMVKQAFLDPDIKAKLFLTSANSINIARLIPQTFYYFRAYAQLTARDRPVVVSVPSGNFGNLTAGLIARRMGLPVDTFVASTNINDVVPVYLRTQSFHPGPSKETISNAMDVGSPSNFERMVDLYDRNYNQLTDDVKGFSFTDDETRAAMLDAYRRTGYVMDPHGAVGWLGLRHYMKANPEVQGIFLETAHPGKFIAVVEDAIQTSIDLPDRLKSFLSRKKVTTAMPNRFQDFKEWIL